MNELELLQQKLFNAERHAKTLMKSKYGANQYPLAKIMVESIKNDIEVLQNTEKPTVKDSCQK
jgi:predicted component of type VI protein secretion system